MVYKQQKQDILYVTSMHFKSFPCHLTPMVRFRQKNQLITKIHLKYPGCDGKIVEFQGSINERHKKKKVWLKYSNMMAKSVQLNGSKMTKVTVSGLEQCSLVPTNYQTTSS